MNKRAKSCKSKARCPPEQTQSCDQNTQMQVSIADSALGGQGCVVDQGRSSATGSMTSFYAWETQQIQKFTNNIKKVGVSDGGLLDNYVYDFVIGFEHVAY